MPLTVTRPSAMSVSASRREQAPLSLKYLLMRTRADPTPGALLGNARFHAEKLVEPLMVELETSISKFGVTSRPFALLPCRHEKANQDQVHAEPRSRRVRAR